MKKVVVGRVWVKNKSNNKKIKIVVVANLTMNSYSVLSSLHTLSHLLLSNSTRFKILLSSLSEDQES